MGRIPNYMSARCYKHGASDCLGEIPLKLIKILLQKYGFSAGRKAICTKEVNMSAVMIGQSSKHAAPKQ